MGGMVHEELPALPRWFSFGFPGGCICLYINLASCSAQSRAYMVEFVSGFQRLEELWVGGEFSGAQESQARQVCGLGCTAGGRAGAGLWGEMEASYKASFPRKV